MLLRRVFPAAGTLTWLTFVAIPPASFLTESMPKIAEPAFVTRWAAEARRLARSLVIVFFFCGISII